MAEEKKKISLGLIPKLIAAIVLGIIIGILSKNAGTEIPVRILATFNSVFGNFLGFSIPLIIIGFVVSGIGDLGDGAGKTLAITTGVAYCSTLIAGTLAFLVATNTFGMFLQQGTLSIDATNPEEQLLATYLTINMPPIMDVMSALLISFVLGLGISALNKNNKHTLSNVFHEIQDVITGLVSKVLIPLLPIHVAGIFCNMAHAGTVFTILGVFIKVYLIVICLHIVILIFQYTVGASAAGKNPFVCIKNMIPAYLTAIGTQSSAATIPVTLQSAKNNGVRSEVADFVIPLCATIHLSGSTITLTSCAIAVMMLEGMPVEFGKMIPFIAMLGVTMVAAPGVPGGAVMAALGILQTMLGFGETEQALMIALYLTQDSFGTACNVTGDGAIALFVDKITAKGGNNSGKKVKAAV